MKNPIEALNKIFDSRIRLGVMSVLIVNDSVSFNELKQMLDLTDGNLASHLNTLEQAEYINVQKAFIGKKTNTTYRITELGTQSFKAHLNALEKMIKGI
ncbi:winged helix-turn-helix domain-containing protein [Pedobacter ureilyticus]|uniref:Winged helix-turn-helix domain-containing protein n=1 Tax=Pedobacter ureilyticus TaxID=1393051 RepID=A0ABW9J7S8_9SPHI|nr:transcriptional regulator [Pedobacter helvus]